MGSKARIAQEILPIILEGRKEGQFYVEPFCGGCNSLQHVAGNRIGGDLNKYLIAMWQGLQNNSVRPYSIDKDLYDSARTEYHDSSNINFSDFEIGWIGWMASFNGRFFDGGYSGITGTRDYVSEQIKNTEKQIPLIRDVEFFQCDYSELPIPPLSIIYCDIPYKGTKQYAASRNFDYGRFWNWCRLQKEKGHDVFVSEYSAPDGVECLWSKRVTNSMHTKITKQPVEKLFKI